MMAYKTPERPHGSGGSKRGEATTGRRRSNKSASSRRPRTNPSSTNDPLPDLEKVQYLHELVAQHVDSFNFAVTEGLAYAVNDIGARELVYDGDNGRKLRMWLEEVNVGFPTRSQSEKALDSRIFPSESRARHIHYGAQLSANVCFEQDGEVVRLNRNLGEVPIMVGSVKCHLRGLGPAEMLRRHEDATEMGGYFVCNGNERVVRLLQIPRRNHIMAVDRPSFKKRGPTFSTKAVSMRCVGPDQVGSTVTLHYLLDGTAMVKLGIRKAEYFLPAMLVLKALKPPMATDREIYTSILRGAHLDGDTFISDRVELCLRQVADLRLFTAQQCRAYLGSQFRSVLAEVTPLMSDEEAGEVLLRRHVFVHLNNYSAAPRSHATTDASRLSDEEGALSEEEIGQEKFNLLIEMLRKLFAFVSGRVGVDNPDALNNHELLLSGHVYGMILKERLEQYLLGVRGAISREISVMTGNKAAFMDALGRNDPKVLRRMMDRPAEVGRKLFYFMATGNLVSETGLDLMQTAGYTIVAEKLNRFRYLSHFRSVHRGQFFTEMKTTAVRKLLPEAWGYLCPVHTPDGSPCGLLNHLSALCAVVTHHPRGGGPLQGFKAASSQLVLQNSARKKKSRSKSSSTVTSLTPSLVSEQANSLLSPLAELVKNLVAWGVAPSGPRGADLVPPYSHHPVMVDGRLIGYAPISLLSKSIVPRLRRAKTVALGVSAMEVMQRPMQFFDTSRYLRECVEDPHRHYAATLEVCLIPESARGGAYPGLYLFTGAARMLRPVVHLDSGYVELIGPLAQTFMEIAVRPEEVRLGVDTHVEIWPTSMLSVVASMTPFSDFNQSPRNMYQCQMAKQTLGSPAHNYRWRTDNKLYRIKTPQAPLTQNKNHGTFQMDEYPQGTNSVVAVISYTGYDMEDAMIISKGSHDRGFAHACVYKTKILDVAKKDSRGRATPVTQFFSNVHPETGLEVTDKLDLDGLPAVGQFLQNGDPIACVVDSEKKTARVEKFKDTEPAWVDQIRLLGIEGEPVADGARLVSITLRYERNPTVGDKFASRHGQKGVCSVIWPQEDMPFTESGMSPDTIINPHAFPSRMTIGMLIESMAGKAGALHGVYQDATPFAMQGDEEGKTAIDYFGAQLARAGYNYYGSEPLYSGTQGTEMQADIYIGLVYYQRLRHMVSDKSQVRALGPIDPVTRQPVKGRKRGGGVRFGEMERDSLLAHGTSFIMRDRLLNCSDRHIAYVCCNTILSVSNDTGAQDQGHGMSSSRDTSFSMGAPTSLRCRICKRTDQWFATTIPFVFRYLTNELAAMGIKIDVSA
ncbi:DNA-directed RNA polymerase subunit beta [Hondaea fermentalgiana]|uniref:DNA-directed RNA polymerase subunit beta n=1 Tax=Hondaea fermentalgiana TaxID=2315210 RepID=A0A2R5GJ47_9STRA|nr:DNA-directed RNA polymerase subunit beta [Hondaea fermentalgiana]|eukprot:GBG30912.1 DNA-directed RNA polymerase subunit beta [Hondaea fermentalgiana]